MLHGELYEGTADFFVSYKHDTAVQQQGTDKNAGRASRLDRTRDRRKWHNFRVSQTGGCDADIGHPALLHGDVLEEHVQLHPLGCAC